MSMAENGTLVDHLARREIQHVVEYVEKLSERHDKLNETVSDFRRDWASYKPQLKLLIKLAVGILAGVVAVAGTEVWRLIMARP